MTQVADTPPFQILVERYGHEVYAYLWRMLGDPNQAQDCLQEVYVRAWRAYDGLEHHAHLRAWLYRIATNTALSHRKGHARDAARHLALPESLASSTANPLQQVIARELLGAVMEAVQALPGQQRAALMLRKYQGLSYAQIGEALQCSPATARAHVYQGLKKLRHVVQAYEQEAA